MSVESWKQEFYPVPADKCPPGELISHSLRKWRGYRHDNMRKHGLDPSFNHNQYDSEDTNTRPGYSSLDAGTSSTCSLCVQYQHRDGGTEPCVHCPLYKIRNGQCCYEGKDSPYNVFMYEKDNNPEPMIRLLEEALRQSLPAVTPVVGGVYRTRKGHEIRIDRIEPDAVPDSRVIGTHQIDIAGYRSGWAHACCLDGYYYDGSDPTDRPNDKDLVEVVSLPDPLRTPEAFAASKPPSTQGQNVSTHSTQEQNVSTHSTQEWKPFTSSTQEKSMNTLTIIRDPANNNPAKWIDLQDMPYKSYGIIRKNPTYNNVGHLVVSIYSTSGSNGYRVADLNSPNSTWSGKRDNTPTGIMVEPVTVELPLFDLTVVEPPKPRLLSPETVGKFFVARNGDVYYHRSYQEQSASTPSTQEQNEEQRATLVLFHEKGKAGTPHFVRLIKVYDDGVYAYRSNGEEAYESSFDILRPLSKEDLCDLQASFVSGYYVVQCRRGNRAKKVIVEYDQDTRAFRIMGVAGSDCLNNWAMTSGGDIVYPYQLLGLLEWRLSELNGEHDVRCLLHNFLPVYLKGAAATEFLESEVLHTLEGYFVHDERGTLHPCDEYGERLNDEEEDDEELDEEDEDDLDDDDEEDEDDE